MSIDQLGILWVLGATILLFLWGKWRHDMVAMAALLACVALGYVKPENAFVGFGHPAVITVACVLVLSRALQTTGAIDFLTARWIPRSAGPLGATAALTVLAALLSGFINNVGTLALLMPVAIHLASKHHLPPGRVLMPLAFGSILGGMTTLIGTPPNLIVAGFREQAGMEPFRMFDFSPVGLGVAGTGVLFIVLIGWRLVPSRKRSGVEGFDSGSYITEARVPEGSRAVGKSLREIGPVLAEADAQVLGIAHGRFRVAVPDSGHILRAGDILMIEAEPDSLAQAISGAELELEEAVEETSSRDAEDDPADSRELSAGDSSKAQAMDGEVVLMELTVRPGGEIEGMTASDLQLRSRYRINLLAISRRGERSIRRLRSQPVRAGDVLLVQGTPEAIHGFSSAVGCIPLAERSIRIPDPRRAALAGMAMLLAILLAALGWMPAALAFAAAVLSLMVFRVVQLRSIYEAIDWPMIVLLAALMPVAASLESTGAADLLARFLLDALAQGNALFGLALILVVTMTLSDFMNNAATAAVMCPVALSAASRLDSNPDAFLMAVAVGASCAFLTPVGHQNNTLILGPGGFRFGDYWRLGLPLEIIVVAVSVPLLAIVWPL
ncbi:MAG: SLC13 family permease [Luteolibacter sp.]